MLGYTTEHFELSESSQVGEARRAAQKICARLQFTEQAASNASIILTELCTNLVKHAKDGSLLLNGVWGTSGSWIDILSVDKGPGIENLSACLQDGFSSSGTAGNGLGAVRRMAGKFEITSKPGAGTVILARVFSRADSFPTLRFQVGAINLPKAGEPVSGDSWAVKNTATGMAVIVADGLGHGISAADASTMAVKSFQSESADTPVELLKAAHDKLRSTRGAAAAVAHIDVAAQQVNYAGIGNVSSVIIDEELKSRSMVSQNGIVGHEAKRFTEFQYPWRDSSTLIMYSDGLSTQLNYDKFPGLTRRDPALIAAALWSEHTRKRDDATVVVVR